MPISRMTIMLGLFVCMLNSACGRLGNARLLYVEPSDISLKLLHQGDPIVVSVSIRNGGEGPLSISEIKGSCHCEEVTVGGEKKGAIVLQGEEEVTLRARFDTKYSWGDTRYAVSFASSDPAQPFAVVLVRARIGPIMKAVPERLAFGRMHVGEEVVRTVRIRLPPGDPLTPALAISPSTNAFRLLSVRHRAKATVSGFPEGIDVCEADVVARSERPGDIVGALRVSRRGREAEELLVPLSGTVVSEFIVRPSAIALPRITERGQQKSAEISWRHIEAVPFALRVRENPNELDIVVADVNPGEKLVTVTLEDTSLCKSATVKFELQVRDTTSIYEIPVVINPQCLSVREVHEGH